MKTLIEKIADIHMDAGWREFVREIRKDNIRSNKRLFKVLTRAKGSDWVNAVKSLLPKGEPWHTIRFTNLVSGIAIEKEHIGEYVINYNSHENRHTVYVEVKTDKYLMIKI